MMGLRWFTLRGLLLIAALPLCFGDSYADMYYRVESTAAVADSSVSHRSTWWAPRAVEKLESAPLVFDHHRLVTSIGVPFTMDFFGIKGGVGVNPSPFFTRHGVASMARHDPCHTPSGVLPCDVLLRNGGRLTAAECRADPSLNSSIAATSVEHKAYRHHNVGVPWTVVALYAGREGFPTAAWADSEHQCLVLQHHSVTSGPLQTGLFRGQVELCRNGTVTLRYESVPSIPEEGRVAALRRCLALAASNATDPAFVLEPFVGLSANERMAISLPPPRWVTTAGPNGTATRRLTVTAYRITPRHLLTTNDHKPSLQRCARMLLTDCRTSRECVWCWGARPTDEKTRSGHRPLGRCMHTADAAAFCPPGQSGATECEVWNNLERACVQYAQELRPGGCDGIPDGPLRALPDIVSSSLGECDVQCGTASCGPLLHRTLTVAVGAGTAWARRRAFLPDYTTFRFSSLRGWHFFDWDGHDGRAGATVHPASGTVAFTFCHPADGANPSFIPSALMARVGFYIGAYQQWLRNPELHIAAGITIAFTPIDRWAYCGRSNTTHQPCPEGYVAQGPQGCVLASPAPAPKGANDTHATRPSVVFKALWALLLFVAVVLFTALGSCLYFGCRAGRQRLTDGGPAGSGSELPEETPATFPVYRDAFAPLLSTQPSLPELKHGDVPAPSFRGVLDDALSDDSL